MKYRMIRLALILLCFVAIGCSKNNNSQNNSFTQGKNESSNEIVEVKQTPPDESNRDVVNSKLEKVEKKTENISPEEQTENKSGLVLGSLKKVVSDGCSCSVRDLVDRSKNSDEPKLLFIADLDNNSPAYLNINGKDMKFSLLKRGNRPNDANSKTPYEDVYETNGMIAKIKYVFNKSGCPKGEECESSEFDVTITIIKDKEVVTKSAKGICGC